VTRHPAKFSTDVLRTINSIVTAHRDERTARILDPFAGTGRVHELALAGEVATLGIEIEREWASMHPSTVWGDARHAWSLIRAGAGWTEVDFICTSPTYGNRMADSHNARDASRRNTYTHAIGRKLAEANTGAMQWGPDYRRLHEEVYAAAVPLLASNGLFVLNVSDHIRNREVMPVTAWHVEALEWLGLAEVKRHEVETPRLRFGENHEARIEHESVIVLARTN